MDKKTFKKLATLVGTDVTYPSWIGPLTFTVLEVSETSDFVCVEIEGHQEWIRYEFLFDSDFLVGKEGLAKEK